MPTPSIETIYQEQQCKFDVPADTFQVHHGHKDGSTVTCRLNEDVTVYLGDNNEARYPNKSVSATVPFELFVAEWPRFVEYMRAKAADAGKEKQ